MLSQPTRATPVRSAPGAGRQGARRQRAARATSAEAAACGGDTYPGTGGYIGQGGAVVGAGGATPYSCFSGGYAGSGPGLLTGYDRCSNSMHSSHDQERLRVRASARHRVPGGRRRGWARQLRAGRRLHGQAPRLLRLLPGFRRSGPAWALGELLVRLRARRRVWPGPDLHVRRRQRSCPHRALRQLDLHDRRAVWSRSRRNYNPNPGCPSEAFACQTSADQCAVDSDCKPPNQCTYQNGRRVCSPVQCVIGRPFLVGGVERLARRSGEGGWRGHGDRPDVARIGARDRARLAEAWTKVGLMEHASIAAFARFTLQLMSLGAPADLIERSNAATRDETAHAKLAFGIASAYAGRDVGPGPLDVRGALDESTLESILVNVIREGCIGETVAAVEAAEALEHAVDPAVRRALAQITDDELRHADLAWQFVRWALESGGDGLRAIAAREFESAREGRVAVAASAETSGSDDAMLAGGILPEAWNARFGPPPSSAWCWSAHALCSTTRRKRRSPSLPDSALLLHRHHVQSDPARFLRDSGRREHRGTRSHHLAHHRCFAARVDTRTNRRSMGRDFLFAVPRRAWRPFSPTARHRSR